MSKGGLKPQLVARLNKALNTEKAQNDTKSIEESDTKVEEVENSQQAEENGQQTDEPAEVEMASVGQDDHDANKPADANDSKKEPPRKLDEKERQQLERRYQLPDTPHIVIHPSKVAKSGKFDCTVMSLSVLLDYRPEDTKERSFEVSLFAELFNEMLMRDFGFNIYKEIVMLPEKAKDKDGKVKEEKGPDDNDEKSKDNAEKKEGSEREKSRERLMSDSDRSDKKSAKDPEKKAGKKSYDDDTEDDDYSVKSGDRRKKTKMIVAKPELLLSFVYFDTTHCGYIFEKDLEELFYIIGLNLSRAQVRKLLVKVISRDAIYYRKLTDKPKDDEQSTATAVDVPQNGDAINVDVAKLAQGNRAFLPLVEKSHDNIENDATQLDQSDSNAGMVMYNGGLLDVEKLMEQMKRSEKAREDIEEILTDLRKQNSELQSSTTKANNKIKDLQSETKSLNRKLNDAEQNISSLNKKHNEYYNILSSIYDKISPVFAKSERSSKSDSRDKEREKERERERERDKDELKDSVKVEVKKE